MAVTIKNITVPGTGRVIIKVDAITAPPVANFTGAPLSGLFPLTVDFTDTSINDPTSWAWDFDNNGSIDSTLQNPSHTYNTVGVYSVKLTATNALGSNSITKSGYITVNATPQAPIANFTSDINSGSFPLTVNFTDTSSNDPTSWLWDFKNDGTATSTLQNPSFTYPAAGTFTVKMTATNLIGSNTVTKTNFITVIIPVFTPVANFTSNVTTGILPLTVNFTDTSTNIPTSWAWDFQNNGSIDSTLQNPSFTYSTQGIYAVKLIATNSAGSNQIVKTSYIIANSSGAPVANFTVSPTLGPTPLAVTFTDTSTNTPTSWAWDFTNDGSTDSTLRNPTFTYTSPGTYTVKLTATNSKGTNIVTKTDFITVGPPGGQQVFTTSGTFTVPTGITSISAVMVGGGGSGIIRPPNTGRSGGGGGGLRYINDLPVNPGDILTVTVGPGSTTFGGNGGDSNIRNVSNQIVCFAGGGFGGAEPADKPGAGGTGSAFGAGPFGGTIAGGNGGSGGWGATNVSGGGGGAGGYSGNGGSGSVTGPGAAGAASSGAAGAAASGANASSGGGGVGLVTKGNTGSATGASGGKEPGQPGSGGQIGGLSTLDGQFGNGGLYGGGGGGQATGLTDGKSFGGNGGVRIIWGLGRTYPTNSKDI